MAKKKAEPKVLTEEEMIEEQIRWHYSCDSEFLCNEPTRTYEVGEHVRFGNHPNAVIMRVLDDGKYYVVKAYGSYKVYHNMVEQCSYHVLPWHRFYKLREEEPASLHCTKQYLQLNYSQRDIMGLLSSYYCFGVDMNPEYQRDYVWSMEDKVQLIESIFTQVDIGKFVFVHKKYQDNAPTYEILDGKQRLNAIIEFFEDRFEWRGKKFTDLSARDQDYFEGYSISHADIREGVTREQIIEIFIKLNTCGKTMDADHIENVKKLLK